MSIDAADKPWLARSDWASRKLSSVTGQSLGWVAAIWFFALLWNGVLITIFVLMAVLHVEISKLLFFILLPFCLAGLFVIWLAVVSTVSLVRYRGVTLHLDTLPGVIGGRLAGTIHAKAALLDRGDVRVRLRSWRRYSGDTSDDVLWEELAVIDPSKIQRLGTEGIVPFRFDIPYECEPVSDEPRIEWVVTIESAKRHDAASFTVPVFRTSDSSPAQTEAALRPRAPVQPTRSRVRLRRDDAGVIEAMFPRPSWVWKWYVFALLVGATLSLVVQRYTPAFVPETMLSMYRTVAYGAVVVVVVFLFLFAQLALALTPRLLRIDPRELRLSYASPLRRTKIMATADIADFVPALSTSSSSYSLDIKRSDGSAYPWLMLTASDKDEARWLAHELRRALRR